MPVRELLDAGLTGQVDVGQHNVEPAVGHLHPRQRFLSRARLLETAWANETYTERTVDTVVSRLRKKLERDTLAVLHNARALFPNLHIAYLGSRIYGGYATGGAGILRMT